MCAKLIDGAVISLAVVLLANGWLNLSIAYLVALLLALVSIVYAALLILGPALRLLHYMRAKWMQFRNADKVDELPGVSGFRQFPIRSRPASRPSAARGYNYTGIADACA